MNPFPTYHHSVRMASLVICKLLPTAKAAWTNINAITLLTDRIRAFYANRVGEVAGAGVAFDLEPGLAHSYVT